METLWTYTDNLGIAQAAELGVARARSADWSTGSLAVRVRAWNGVLLETARCMGTLWGEISVTPDGKEIYIHPGFRRPAVAVERANAAVTLYRTIYIVGKFQAREGGEIHTSPPPITEGDVGIPWPLVAAAAIVAVGQAVAIGYCAHQAAQVVDRHLARKAELQRVVQQHATALEVVRAHQAKEAKAGKELPLDAASKQVLGSLAKEQDELAKRNAGNWGPLSSGLPPLPSFAAATGGFTLGALAAGAFAVWLLMQGSRA